MRSRKPKDSPLNTSGWRSPGKETMMDEATGRQVSPGRELRTFVREDSADEIELAALDDARRFFGEDARLEVVRDYRAWNNTSRDAEKRYYATVTVRVIES
jgi:hypothetical protein